MVMLLPSDVLDRLGFRLYRHGGVNGAVQALIPLAAIDCRLAAIGLVAERARLIR
jgi:hypothetical protein